MNPRDKTDFGYGLWLEEDAGLTLAALSPRSASFSDHAKTGHEPAGGARQADVLEGHWYSLAASSPQAAPIYVIGSRYFRGASVLVPLSMEAKTMLAA